MSIKCCCHGCGERTKTCHVECKKYHDWNDERLAKKRAIAVAKTPDSMLDRYEAKDKPKRLKIYKR